MNIEEKRQHILNLTKRHKLPFVWYNEKRFNTVLNMWLPDAYVSLDLEGGKPSNIMLYIPEIVCNVTYTCVLHEIGHLLHPLGTIGASTLLESMLGIYKPELLTSECAAWTWAFAHCKGLLDMAAARIWYSTYTIKIPPTDIYARKNKQLEKTHKLLTATA